MKLRRIVTFLLLVLTLSLSGCGWLIEMPQAPDTGEANGFDTTDMSFATAYAEAQKLGFRGTLEEFIELISGEDGEDGEDGRAGRDGRGIASVSVNKDGNLIVVYSDGTSTPARRCQNDGERRRLFRL